MVGAYSLYVFYGILKLPAAAAIILTIIVCAVLGVVIEKVAYKPLAVMPSLWPYLITAIGVSFLLQNLALLIFKATPIRLWIYDQGSGSKTRRHTYFRDYNSDAGCHNYFHDFIDPVYQQNESRTGYACGVCSDKEGG